MLPRTAHSLAPLSASSSISLFEFVPGLPEAKLDPEGVLGAQREALLRMRSDEEISNEVMYRILRELDLEESRPEI